MPSTELLASNAPTSSWEDMKNNDHFVQFYEDEAFLLASVFGYVRRALETGGAAIVVATKPHLDALERQWAAAGVEIAAARERGQYVPLDATETLAKLLLDEWPQKRRFADTVEPVIAAAASRFPQVAVFGEMVGLLWKDGKYSAAIHLEALWNELATRHSFALFCAYPMISGKQAPADALHDVCAHHSHAIPTESYSALASHAERLREICRLQEKASAHRMTEEELHQLNDTLEQRVAERTAELQSSERQFRLLVAGVTDYAIYMLDLRGNIVSWNSGAERIKQYTAEEIIGRHFSEFYTPEDRQAGQPQKSLSTALQAGRYSAEGWRVRKDGSRFWASVVIDAIPDESGQLVGFAKVTRDITERKQLEEQLRQSQKMEAIGQLTGGVAHDFNNLLIIILGNLETLRRQLDLGNPDPARLRLSAENAHRGAQRAAALTQQLLAFSRRQPLEPKPVDANKLVRNMSQLLRRTLGEQVDVETVLAGGLWYTHADPNQLESAVLNLAVNARDAMPEGGKLTIETVNVRLDQGYADRQIEVGPGEYVVLSITDTGSGMTQEVMAHAFEPFFTTKDVGHGTDLGLSQVYGFVKQSGGSVKLYSEVGQGTTVRIYLPRMLVEHDEEAEPDPASAPEAPKAASPLMATILVVEDDDDVRTHSTGILKELGYRVLEAPNGRAALDTLGREPRIGLLFTDVVLPGGMNGRQLADEARRRRPGLKVLFTTGYAKNAIMHDGRLDPGVHLLAKPFTYAALATKVRGLLERDGPQRVLVVEDIPQVRMVAVDMLETLGFRVEEAASAAEALNLVRAGGNRIDAAIIDVGLPDRRGDALAAELRTIYPDLPIVIASGYGEAAIQGLVEDGLVRFLTKPYDTQQLEAELRSLGLEPAGTASTPPSN